MDGKMDGVMDKKENKTKRKRVYFKRAFPLIKSIF
jgi:hypothetical protein